MAVSPSAFATEESDWGIAVDDADAEFDPTEGRVLVNASLAIKGKNGVFWGVSYQVSFLAFRGPNDPEFWPTGGPSGDPRFPDS